MKSLPRVVWQYAIMLIVLLALAAFAAWTTMSFLYDNIPEETYSRILDIAAFKIWALTMGFMLIAGALGLWAIQFSAESESRRRMGQVVEGMNYLNDALMLVDRKGRITASNPALKAIVPAEQLRNHASLTDIFPCLTESDVQLLVDIRGPNEIQKDTTTAGGKKITRFRSQTAGGIVLVFASDITTMKLSEMQKQHVARFELIGRIARGVTNDFNNILAGISGYASLLMRLPAGSPETKQSISAIIQESERGALLAGHLLEFSRLSAGGRPTDSLGEHVIRASELVRVGLSSEWKVEPEIRSDFPVVPLSGLQVEQVVLNLALVIADASPQPATIHIVAGRPSRQDHLMNISEEFAAVIIISTTNSGIPVLDPSTRPELREKHVDESGVIQSVVRSLIEETGGALDFFTGTDNSKACRIALPYGTLRAQTESEGNDLADELRAYVSHWQVLLARSTRGHDYLEEKLKEVGAKVERVNNVVSALARIEDSANIHAMVFDKDLLGNEASGLLRAITKLCPKTGIVVMCEDPDREQGELSRNIIFITRRAEPGRILRAMVDARALVVKHHH